MAINPSENLDLDIDIPGPNTVVYLGFRTSNSNPYIKITKHIDGYGDLIIIYRLKQDSSDSTLWYFDDVSKLYDMTPTTTYTVQIGGTRLPEKTIYSKVHWSVISNDMMDTSKEAELSDSIEKVCVIDDYSMPEFEKLTFEGDKNVYMVKDLGASSASMPSNRYIDLTLAANGAEYIAPANGTVYFKRMNNGASGVTNTIVNNRTGIVTESFSPYTVAVSSDVEKGDVVTISYTGSASEIVFRFYYAEGEK